MELSNQQGILGLPQYLYYGQFERVDELHVVHSMIAEVRRVVVEAEPPVALHRRHRALRRGPAHHGGEDEEGVPERGQRRVEVRKQIAST